MMYHCSCNHTGDDAAEQLGTLQQLGVIESVHVLGQTELCMPVWNGAAWLCAKWRGTKFSWAVEESCYAHQPHHARFYRHVALITWSFVGFLVLCSLFLFWVGIAGRQHARLHAP